ncbi:hypothetical protein [Roseivivax sp.]
MPARHGLAAALCAGIAATLPYAAPAAARDTSTIPQDSTAPEGLSSIPEAAPRRGAQNTPESAGQRPGFATPEARAAFGAELRALILDEPEIVGRALTPTVPEAADIYAEEREADLATLAEARAALFDPAWPRLGAAEAAPALAFVTEPGCQTCAEAQAELVNLLDRLGLTATRIDAGSPRGAALMDRLTLDAVPSYVLPDMMVRGQVPSFVLERYLSP